MTEQEYFEGLDSLDVNAEEELLTWTVPEDTEQALLEYQEQAIIAHIVSRVAKDVDEDIDGWYGVVGLLYESGGKDWSISLEALGVSIDDFEKQ